MKLVWNLINLIIALVLLLFCFSSLEAQGLDPARFNCPYGTIGLQEEIICAQFPSFEEAERNFYHCQEGIAIMGAAINMLKPSFVPVLSTEDFDARAGQDCSSSFEIYPDSGICPFHATHKEAEWGYINCQTTNYQYWDYLQFLIKQPLDVFAKMDCVDAGSIRDGAGNFLWKPLGDPNALCRGRAAVLSEPLLADFVPVGLFEKGLFIYDSAGELIGDGFYKGNSNGNRPSYCTDRAGASYDSQPIYVKFLVKDAPAFCKRVDNPSSRED